MKLDIVLASYLRPEKLNVCLNSIFKSANDIPVTVYVYFSIRQEYELYQQMFAGVEALQVRLLDSYSVPSLWNGHLAATKADAVFCTTDDTEFHLNSVSNIMQEFIKAYPDTDGVLGVTQANLPADQALPSAYNVIGRRYADRFPGRAVWCPDYARMYADQELGDYARSINKFTLSPIAKITHWHPAYGGRRDTTHDTVRTFLDRDRRTYNQRRDNHWLWGREFNLVNVRT